jgi:hypothetical protein
MTKLPGERALQMTANVSSSSMTRGWRGKSLLRVDDNFCQIVENLRGRWFAGDAHGYVSA